MSEKIVKDLVVLYTPALLYVMIEYNFRIFGLSVTIILANFYECDRRYKVTMCNAYKQQFVAMEAKCTQKVQNIASLAFTLVDESLFKLMMVK